MNCSWSAFNSQNVCPCNIQHKSISGKVAIFWKAGAPLSGSYGWASSLTSQATMSDPRRINPNPGSNKPSRFRMFCRLTSNGIYKTKKYISNTGLLIVVLIKCLWQLYAMLTVIMSTKHLIKWLLKQDTIIHCYLQLQYFEYHGYFKVSLKVPTLFLSVF